MPSLRRLSYSFVLIFATATIFVACLLLASSAAAQTELAGVYGRVTDQSGAVIADAEVEIKNVETNGSITVKTNQDGLYTIPSLHPGHYLINVRKTGFRSVTVTELTLNVQDNVVRNFALQIGSVSETVTITGDQLNINTTDASVSTVIDRHFAENLPLNGRSFQTLIELTPGVVVTPSNLNDNGQFSVNGQRTASNYWTVDGVSANAGVSAINGTPVGNGTSGAAAQVGLLGGTNSIVSVDAMQEFRIQTSTYAPEFGRTPGAQISIVTRSGTNQFHGTLFEYFRNDVLDANDWFNGVNILNPTPLPKAKERQNDFGGTLSGPIVKDKTFFFFSYEGLRLRLPQTTLTTVPDLNARQNAIPSIQPYLNAYPLPNGPEVLDSAGNPTDSAQFNASYSNPASLDAYSLRVDQRINSKLNLFGRYSYSPSSLTVRGPNFPSPLSDVQSTTLDSNVGTLGLTWSISPRLLDDLRFNYTAVDSSSNVVLDTFGGAAPFTSLPLPKDGLLFFGVFSLRAGILYNGSLASVTQRQLNVVDSLAFQVSSHSLKAGVDFRRLTPFRDLPYDLLAGFGNVIKAESASLSFSDAQSNVPATSLYRNLGLYAQDTWRLKPRLTMTYGLRWDVDFAVRSLNGPNYPALANFNPNDLSTFTLAPAGTSPYQTGYHNFAPRAGIAYQASQRPDWQTVVRGGFGVFYDLASSEGNYHAGYPFSNVVRLSSFPPPAAPVVPPSTPLGNDIYSYFPNLKQPYTLEWNVAIEQAVGAEQAVSVSYLGAAGRRLLESSLLSGVNPNFGTLSLVSNNGTSDYEALQLQFQRKLRRGLQAQAAYTWSHSIDTGSESSFFSASDAFAPGTSQNANRAPSDFDIRHSFALGLTYNLPNLKANAAARTLLHGWSLQSFVLARSAPPVDVTDTIFFQQFNGGVSGDTRPDIVPGQAFYLYGSQYPGGKAFNPAAFVSPPVDPITGNPSRQGTTPRNFLRGFGAAQWDFAIHRDFPIRESAKLQFRAEMFNVLNHPNFGPPLGDINPAGFGLSSQMLGQSLNNQNTGGGALSPLYQIGGPRSIQFALKLFF